MPGIYYFSSAAGLNLTQLLQQFSTNSDFFNAHLIIDEFDDTALNDLTSHNVTIDTRQLQILARENAWIYYPINDFYDYVLNNPRLLRNDRHLTQELRNMLMRHAKHAIQQTFVKKLSHDKLLVFFLAANTASCLQEGKDYVLKETKPNLWRAVPLRKGEPQMQSLFSDHEAHACLHARLQKQSHTREFEILPKTANIGSATAKAIFDCFQNNESRIIALTATAGTFEECSELSQKYQMNALQIAPYHANQRIIKPVCVVQTKSDVLDKIRGIIQSETSIVHGRQPIYIYCADGKIAKHYFASLEQTYKDTIQLINGEETDEERARLIQKADADNMITVTTLLLLRGVDYQPSGIVGKEKGGLLIQTFISHQRDTNQVQGRVARNGKFGVYQLLLDSESIPFWNDIKMYSVEEQLMRCRTLINTLEAIQRRFTHEMDDVRQALLRLQDICFSKLQLSSETKKALLRETLLKELDLLWHEALKKSDPNGAYVNHAFCRYHDGKFETAALEEALEQFKSAAFNYWKSHCQDMIAQSNSTRLLVHNDLHQLSPQTSLSTQRLQSVATYFTAQIERFVQLQLEMLIDEKLFLLNVDLGAVDIEDYLFKMHTVKFIEEYNQLLNKTVTRKSNFCSFWTVPPKVLCPTASGAENLAQFVTAMSSIQDAKLKTDYLPLLLKLHFFAKKYSSLIAENILVTIRNLTVPLVNTITLYLKQTLLHLNWHENKYTWYYWLATQEIKDIARDISKHHVNSVDDLNELNEKLKKSKLTLQKMYFQWFLWGHEDTLNCINDLLEQVETLKAYDQEIGMPSMISTCA